jgi:hypothetical protein
MKNHWERQLEIYAKTRFLGSSRVSSDAISLAQKLENASDWRVCSGKDLGILI